MDLAQGAEDVFRAHQFQKITADNGVEGTVAKRHITGIDGLAMSLGARQPAAREALRARGHVGRKVESARQPPGVDPHQTAEHFAGAGGDFEHPHAVADAGERQRHLMRFFVEQKRR